jgi:Na+/melibiose symporter-like transporter
MSENTPTAAPCESKKLSFWQKSFWGIGSGANNIMANAHNYLAMPIYQVALGLDPVILGFAMGFSRLVDAFTDPIIGHISDNTRSRFGRRRPFIFIGAILSALFFMLMWMPPIFIGTGGLAFYFLVISVLYYFSFAVFTIPWGAMGLELTEDYNERTRVQAYGHFVSSICGILLGAMWKLSMVFGSNEIEGVRVVGILFGVTILISAIIPAIFCRENAGVQKQQKITFRDSLFETLKNGPFIKLSVVILLLFLGIFLVNPFAMYININYVFGETNKSVWIDDVGKLQNVIQSHGQEKILDAVSSQRIGQVVARLALEKIEIVSEKMNLTGFEASQFDIAPQDLNWVKNDLSEDNLSKTLSALVIKNLKKNYYFYDIRRFFNRPSVASFAVEVDSACSQDIGHAAAEIKDFIAQAEAIIHRLAQLPAEGLTDAVADIPNEQLDNIMKTTSYYLSKDAVASFNFWCNLVFQASLILAIPIVTWVSARIGKKRTFMTGLILVGIGFSSSWTLYTPKVPYLQVICLSFIGFGLSCIFMLGGSIIADICDIDELRTGRRREGMFGAMYAWIFKAGSAGTLILSGFMLNWSGYSSSAIYRFQPDNIVTSMRYLYMIVPGITAVVAFFIMLATPISEKKMHQVRAELDRLKAAGKLNAQGDLN